MNQIFVGFGNIHIICVGLYWLYYIVSNIEGREYCIRLGKGISCLVSLLMEGIVAMNHSKRVRFAENTLNHVRREPRKKQREERLAGQATIGPNLDTLQLSTPLGPRLPAADATLDFVEDDNYMDILERLNRSVHDEQRELSYHVVRGPMGVGKTTIVWNAIIKFCASGEWNPCYFSMDTMLDIVRGSPNQDDGRSLLSGLLLYEFTKRKIRTIEYDYENLVDRLRKLYSIGTDKPIKIVLHLDQFQDDLNRCGYVLRAIRETMMDRDPLWIIPVVSGIRTLGGIEQVSHISTGFQSIVLECGPLPPEKLRKSLIDSLHISRELYDENKHIQAIFRDCGNVAYMVAILLRAIRDVPEACQALKENQVINEAVAKKVFDKCTDYASNVYGAVRFHATIQRNSDRTRPLEHVRNSARYQETTLPLLQKICLLAFTRRAVISKTPLLPAELDEDGSEKDWSVEKWSLLGIYRLESIRNAEYYVEIPLLILTVMNSFCNVIPALAQLDDPFDHSWQSLERVALCTVLTQLAVRQPRDDAQEKWVSITDLRPGAEYSGPPKLEVCVPKKITFTKLDKRIETKDKDGMTNPDGTFVDLSQVGDFRLTVDGQHGVDGWVNLKGRVDGREVLVVWLSQSKSQEKSLETGQPSGSKLYKSQITKTLLGKMEDVFKSLKGKDPVFENAFVVYDVFSNRLGATRRESHIEMPEDRAMFLTRDDCLNQVLGGFVARRRDIEN